MDSKDGVDVSRTDLFGELISIPVSDRKEQIVVYEVQAKKSR